MEEKKQKNSKSEEINRGDECWRGKQVLILLIEIKRLRENLWRDEVSDE